MMDRRRRLLWHGMLLFLLGLLTGLVSSQFANSRMGLSAHLEGLMNGTFLVAVGAVWDEVRLSRKGAAWAFASALYGTYANWVTTTLAAVLGTSAMTPLAAATHRGTAWQEAIVAVGFISVAIAMLVTVSLLLKGFSARSAKSVSEAEASQRA